MVGIEKKVKPAAHKKASEILNTSNVKKICICDLLMKREVYHFNNQFSDCLLSFFRSMILSRLQNSGKKTGKKQPGKKQYERCQNMRESDKPPGPESNNEKQLQTE